MPGEVLPGAIQQERAQDLPRLPPHQLHGSHAQVCAKPQADGQAPPSTLEGTVFVRSSDMGIEFTIQGDAGGLAAGLG